MFLENKRREFELFYNNPEIYVRIQLLEHEHDRKEAISLYSYMRTRMNQQDAILNTLTILRKIYQFKV